MSCRCLGVVPDRGLRLLPADFHIAGGCIVDDTSIQGKGRSVDLQACQRAASNPSHRAVLLETWEHPIMTEEMISAVRSLRAY